LQPWMQLWQDRAAAAAAADPCASLCSLATVDEQGIPQVRTLVLRNLAEEAGGELGLFINSTSPKWQQLADLVSILVYLPSQQVQYRIQTRLTPIAKSAVDRSWLLRPDTPKRLDVYYENASPQSAPVANREQLLSSLETEVANVPQQAPASAQGLRLQPQTIERLQLTTDGSPHHRTLHHLKQGIWSEQTLVP